MGDESNAAGTLAKARKILRYDPDSGLFAWTKYRSGNARADGAAGYICRGYRVLTIDNQYFRAHRVAWLFTFGRWPVCFIDHINGVKDDNRIANLRECTHSQNMANSKRPAHNTSGFKGVSRSTSRRHRSKWIAQLRVDGRNRYLGNFDTPEEAHAAYVNAAINHFGQFARTA